MLSLSPSECPIRAAYEVWKNHASDSVTFSTILVWIGVALEVPEFIHGVGSYLDRNWFKRKQIANLNVVGGLFPTGEFVENCRHPKWLAKLEAWAKVVGGVGLILVVIGVRGEWINGAELEDANNALHRFDMALLVAANAKAGDAAASAKIARAEADAAKTSASEAQALAASAKDEANEVSQKAVQLRTDLDKVGTEATALQKTLEGLTATALSRRISDPKKFLAALKDQRKAKVLLLYTPNDAESFDFAFDIWKLLGVQGAGWDVSPPTPVPHDWPTPKGWTELETAPPAVKCGAWNGRGVGVRSGIGFEIAITDTLALHVLSKAFSDEGFSTAVHTNEPLMGLITKADDIVLCVGQK